MERITTVLVAMPTRALMSWLIGIIGISLTMVGHHYGYVDMRWAFFSVGAICLFATASLENLTLLAMLQLILLAGSGAMLTKFEITFRMALPILLSLQMIVYFWLSGKLNNWVNVIGCLGTFCLALGYTTHNPFISGIGGACITLYAALLVRDGISVAWLWIILNSYFTYSSIIKIGVRLW